MALNTFAEVQAYITNALTSQQQTDLNSPGCPHKAFWNNLTYEQFTGGSVPGVSPAVQILVVGDSKNSNIIQALQGTGLFDPNTGSYPQMPADGPPFFSKDQIDEIAAWIDNKCPK
jgi:hypothetical protein